jgi:DNA repair exonuclease SbcCD ATPase subunit/DNA repair exonuclease SbcCD nuclease subunit
MIERYDIEFEGKVDKIYHIADVHIRNLKRHKEYREVFDRLYSYIEKTKTEHSVIVLVGDIVHAKTDMTPEVIEMTQSFLTKLSDLCNTILIPGNHDANLNNTSRLDALTPVVNALKHNNLHYFKNNAIIDIGGLTFVHTSIFNETGKIIKAEGIDGEYKISLYHGAVDRVKTEHGFVIEHSDVNVDSFKGYDLALLGDIHVPNQSLNSEGTIKYCGSTIMQNHAEAKYPNHGILTWDVKSKKSEFVPIENDYGYVTIEVESGKVVGSPNIPKKPRIRVRVSDTTQAQLKEIISDIRVGRGVQEVSIHKVINGVTNDGNNHIHLENVRDIAFQDKLIKSFLNDNYILSDKLINTVKDINNDINKKLGSYSGFKNIIWKPKKFKFSNMFSYGEDNVIDFTNMAGTYGIFAPNTSGKSSLWDALSFCLFDKCSRTSKAVDVLNFSKEMFDCNFEFEINGKSYFIERHAKKSPKRGTVKVDVDFYTFDSNGDKESLNGEERRETNSIIRNYVGSYDDFILTAMSTQNDSAGFIKKSQKERKELLAQFLDMDVFEELYQIANDELKELGTLLKDYKKRNLSKQLSEAIDSYNLEKVKLDVCQVEFKSKNDEKLNLKNKLEKLLYNKKDITLSIDIDTLISEKNSIDVQIIKKSTECSDISSVITDKSKQLKSKSKQLKSYNLKELQEKHDKYTSYKHDLDSAESELKLIDIDVNHKQNHLDGIGSLSFDSNCDHCVSNKNTPFAKESNKLSGELNDLNIRKSHLSIQIEGLIELVEKHNVNDTLNVCLNLYDDIDDLENDIEKENLKNKTCNLQLDGLNSQLKTLESKTEEYEKQKENIKFNKKLEVEISDVRLKLSHIESEIQKLSDQATDISGDIKVYDKVITDANQALSELKDMESKYNGYEYYLKCVKRDGIPYKLISDILPKIEDEINNILSSIVEFKIILDTDGRNINSYIAYEADEFWPLELTSGMEQFISSVAIRSALINVSNLPRPNFITIDEGFSSLDSSNFSSLYLLFDYLKSQFEFIVTISHIDKTRDMVDQIIDIEKQNGFSSIRYL